MARLDIVVPIFNAQLYLDKLLCSVINQKYKEFRLILVDDGSIDYSSTMVDENTALNTKLVAVHQRNNGQGEARNTGIEISNCEYIAFVDNDDIVHPSMYCEMIDAINRNECFVCASDFMNVQNELMDEICYCTPAKDTFITGEELTRHMLSPTWRVPVWNKVYCREILDGLSFSNAKLGEDNLFSYHIIKKCSNKGIAFIDSPLYFQRMHGDNYEFSGWRHMNELLIVKEQILNDIKENFPYEYDNAKIRFIDECVRVYNMFYCRGSGCELEKREAINILIRNSCGIVKLFIA